MGGSIERKENLERVYEIGGEVARVNLFLQDCAQENSHWKIKSHEEKKEDTEIPIGGKYSL